MRHSEPCIFGKPHTQRDNGGRFKRIRLRIILQNRVFLPYASQWTLYFQQTTHPGRGGGFRHISLGSFSKIASFAICVTVDLAFLAKHPPREGMGGGCRRILLQVILQNRVFLPCASQWTLSFSETIHPEREWGVVPEGFSSAPFPKIAFFAICVTVDPVLSANHTPRE